MQLLNETSVTEERPELLEGREHVVDQGGLHQEDNDYNACDCAIFDSYHRSKSHDDPKQDGDADYPIGSYSDEEEFLEVEIRVSKTLVIIEQSRY